MNYKKKYKDALERAKVWKEKSGMSKDKQGILDDIFPELAESEDEKIRKEIIQSIRDNMVVIHKDECIAWLEKQDNVNKEYWRGYREGKKEILDKYSELEKQNEQKPVIEMITPEESLGMSSEEYKKIVDTCLYGEKIESKPSWTEEDEEHIHSLLDRLEGMCKKGSTFITTRFAINEDEDWLKSLKQKIGE